MNQCISETELGAYIDGTLTEEKKNVIEKHFVHCSKCWNEFIAVRQVMTVKNGPEEEVPERVIRSVVSMFPSKSSIFDIVLKLARDTVEVIQHSVDFSMPETVPAYALRGDKDTTPGMAVLKRSFDEITVELHIEKMQENLCNIRVAVEDLTSGDLLNTLRLELVSGGRELSSSRLEKGEAVLEDISTGLYTIKLLNYDRTFGEVAIKIQ
jgi:hypothetical protein